jgi:protein-tyrosine-phosphatase
MMMAALRSELVRRRIDWVVVESAGVNHEASSGHFASLKAQSMFPGQLLHHRSRWIGDLRLNQYNFILCMTEEHKKRVLQQRGSHVSRIWVYPGELQDPVLPVDRTTKAFEIMRDRLTLWAKGFLNAFVLCC